MNKKNSSSKPADELDQKLEITEEDGKHSTYIFWYIAVQCLIFSPPESVLSHREFVP